MRAHGPLPFKPNPVSRAAPPPPTPSSSSRLFVRAAAGSCTAVVAAGGALGSPSLPPRLRPWVPSSSPTSSGPCRSINALHGRGGESEGVLSPWPWSTRHSLSSTPGRGWGGRRARGRTGRGGRRVGPGRGWTDRARRAGRPGDRPPSLPLDRPAARRPDGPGSVPRGLNPRRGRARHSLPSSPPAPGVSRPASPSSRPARGAGAARRGAPLTRRRDERAGRARRVEGAAAPGSQGGARGERDEGVGGEARRPRRRWGWGGGAGRRHWDRSQTGFGSADVGLGTADPPGGRGSIEGW